jgi:hypothetical protein
MARRSFLALFILYPAIVYGAHASLGMGSRFLGSALTVRWKGGPSSLNPLASAFGQKASFFHGLPDALGNSEYAILAIPLSAKTGPHLLELHWHEGQELCEEHLIFSLKRRPGKLGTIHLPPKASAAIQELPAESKLLKHATELSLEAPLWRGYFELPLASPRLTQAFGVRSRYLPGNEIWVHKGVDLAAALGTTVSADNDGVVVLAKEDLKAYGGLLVIDHGYELCTIYMHLSRVLVHPGETVHKGEPLAMSGSGGIATGPHLHWQLELRGIPIDPLPWIDKEERAALE